jgi:hypothetical protein
MDDLATQCPEVVETPLPELVDDKYFHDLATDSQPQRLDAAPQKR